jgi:YD repeat-containing protein
VSPYSYNSSNELTALPSGSYTYDNNGNTLTDSTGRHFTWDYENRLTQVVLPGTGGTVNFKYDPFGRRIQKAFTQNGTTTTANYVYDGANVLETLDQNDNLLARFTGTHVGVVANNWISGAPGAGRCKNQHRGDLCAKRRRL